MPPAAANAKREAYQRIVRLSPAQRSASSAPNKRIGAIASSLAGDENEIVLFSATSTRPDNAKDIVERIALHKGQEVNDLDIADRGDGKFDLAYSLDHDVYVQDLEYDFAKKKSLGTPETRRKLYSIPFPDLDQKRGRSKIRCVRWLSPTHLLLLINKPNRNGVELWVVRIYEEGPGSIILRKVLPGHAKAAVDMDVALLDTDSDGAFQAVIGVAAIDVSLIVLTIDYHGYSRDSLGSFHVVDTYHNVRAFQTSQAKKTLIDAGT